LFCVRLLGVVFNHFLIYIVRVILQTWIGAAELHLDRRVVGRGAAYGLVRGREDTDDNLYKIDCNDRAQDCRIVVEPDSHSRHCNPRSQNLQKVKTTYPHCDFDSHRKSSNLFFYSSSLLHILIITFPSSYLFFQSGKLLQMN